MPLEIYKRGNTWWVKGRIDGVDGYTRQSLGTSDEAVAEAQKRGIETKARQRAILGADAPKPEDELTFSGAVLKYNAKPREAIYLTKIIPIIGNQKVRDISGKSVKDMAKKLYPYAACDTWRRQVISPVRAVINNAHELRLCAPIRIKAFTRTEIVEQDRFRGKQSRVAKQPSNWEWIEAFRAQAFTDRLPYMAALALFMFTTGARVSQSCDIRRPRDIDLSQSRVFLPAAKGHPAQWIDIIPAMVVDIANLTPKNGLLFGYRSRSSINGTWARICDRAKIDHIAPHAAGRHGFGTELLVRQEVDAVTIAKAGRWSSPRVPLETYAHAENTKDKVQSAMEKGRFRTNQVQGNNSNAAKKL